MRQLALIPNRKIALEFGGSRLKGKRKSQRPLSTKRPIHLVLKSGQANGKYALNPTDQRLKDLVHKMARKFGVRLYSSAINWSHIHLVIRIYHRQDYVKFIRALSGAMVLKLKAKKGFFELRPFTKVGSWGRQLHTWKDYLIQNQLEARGMKPKLRRRANGLLDQQLSSHTQLSVQN